jgi:hypothetical protein
MYLRSDPSMASTRGRPLGALITSAAVLGALAVTVVEAPASAKQCTFDFEDMAGYVSEGSAVNDCPAGPVIGGDIICGGPGRDQVATMTVAVSSAEAGSAS